MFPTQLFNFLRQKIAAFRHYSWSRHAFRLVLQRNGVVRRIRDNDVGILDTLHHASASAFALNEDQKSRLTAALVKITGKTCSVEATVNPSLKAGLQVRMGDSVVDGTVAYRLRSLRYKLEELQKR